MTTITHMCLDIRGALRRSNQQIEGLLIRDDGGRMKGKEVRDELMDNLAMGRRVLPIGDCDNFSFEEGCLGHPEKTEGPRAHE